MTGFLDQAYTARTAAQTRKLYDDWSASYDAEIAANGYATPGRTARLLAQHVLDRAAPVLDFGCGTGLSGLALALAGFGTIDGADLSAEMLALARAKGLYRRLWQSDPDAPLPVRPGDYATITAIGVIGIGAAPASVIDMLIDALAPGGVMAFSLNDHALTDPQFEARLDVRIADGSVRLLVRDYGDHLPGLNMNSNIYVTQRT